MFFFPKKRTGDVCPASNPVFPFPVPPPPPPPRAPARIARPAPQPRHVNPPHHQTSAESTTTSLLTSEGATTATDSPDYIDASGPINPVFSRDEHGRLVTLTQVELQGR